MDRNEHETMLSDWENIVHVFHAIFDELGDVTEDDEGIAFEARSPDVSTRLVLRRDGLIGASMPLHGMQARATSLRWDDSRTWVRLVGDHVSYTYRIPPEVLRHRAGS